MARSYRTQQESALAARRIHRDACGQPVLPRLIERKPRAGDVHPVGKSLIARYLRSQPVESYYGLRAIELRAREGQVGSPFATYREDSKTIVLYSLPLTWTWPFLSDSGRSELTATELR